MAHSTHSLGRTRGFPQSRAAGADADQYRHLALRVIGLAFRDLASPDGAAEDRASARSFLAGSAMFRHWCAVARLDPRRVMRQASGPHTYINGFSLTEEVTWR